MKAFPQCDSSQEVQHHFNLVEPEETDNADTRQSRNRQLSASCHASSSYDSSEELLRPHRQMRRLSFGSCHTTVEFDRRVPVNESLLHEYDSPTTVVMSEACRWKAEVIPSPPTKKKTLPKQSRPTWTTTTQNDTSKVMPKIPARNRTRSSDKTPTAPRKVYSC
jgi:hypothetical protein